MLRYSGLFINQKSGVSHGKKRGFKKTNQKNNQVQKKEQKAKRGNLCKLEHPFLIIFLCLKFFKNTQFYFLLLHFRGISFFICFGSLLYNCPFFWSLTLPQILQNYTIK
jgi:hypothetical protein